MVYNGVSGLGSFNFAFATGQASPETTSVAGVAAGSMIVGAEGLQTGANCPLSPNSGQTQRQTHSAGINFDAEDKVGSAGTNSWSVSWSCGFASSIPVNLLELKGASTPAFISSAQGTFSGPLITTYSVTVTVDDFRTGKAEGQVVIFQVYLQSGTSGAVVSSVSDSLGEFNWASAIDNRFSGQDQLVTFVGTQATPPICGNGTSAVVSASTLVVVMMVVGMAVVAQQGIRGEIEPEFAKNLIAVIIVVGMALLITFSLFQLTIFGGPC